LAVKNEAAGSSKMLSAYLPNDRASHTGGNKIHIRRDQSVLEYVHSLVMVMNVVIRPSQLLNPLESSVYLIRRLPPALSLTFRHHASYI